MRTVDEIVDVAVKNAKKRVNETQPTQIVVRKTGNKKALHQKTKNRRKTWMD